MGTFHNRVEAQGRENKLMAIFMALIVLVIAFLLLAAYQWADTHIAQPLEELTRSSVTQTQQPR